MTYKDGYKYEDLEIGMAHQTEHVITEKDIELFAEVSGDRNPLHMDEEFAKQTMFGQRIAHGALTASYISGILGNDLPGPGSIFVGLN
ncbi:MAG: MaoC family dehydratase, partial [Pseudomonadota bacterium]